jgi:hypothetical protein
MFLKAIAAGRNPAAINNDYGQKPAYARHYSMIILHFFLRDGFSGGESC